MGKNNLLIKIIVSIGLLTASALTAMEKQVKRPKVEPNQLDELLIGAIRRKNSDLVDSLLLQGASLNTTNFEPYQLDELLIDAISIKNSDLVNSLLLQGANPNTTKGDYQKPALYIASQNGLLDIVQLLLKANANTDDDSWCALSIACAGGFLDIVKALLEAGANPSATETTEEGLQGEYGGWPPLTIATFNQHSEIVQLLLEHKADIESTTPSGSTPLHLAIKQGEIEIAKLLFPYEPDVNAKGRYEMSPLHMAFFDPFETGCELEEPYLTEIVKLLLSNKANIEARDELGFTPLHLAAKCAAGYKETDGSPLENAGTDELCKTMIIEDFARRVPAKEEVNESLARLRTALLCWKRAKFSPLSKDALQVIFAYLKDDIAKIVLYDRASHSINQFLQRDAFHDTIARYILEQANPLLDDVWKHIKTQGFDPLDDPIDTLFDPTNRERVIYRLIRDDIDLQSTRVKRSKKN